MRAAGSILIAALLITVTAVPLLAAAPMVAAWPTWLRVGPGDGARVLDEIQAGDRVQMIGCDQGWCRVVVGRAEGYVDQRMLAASGGPAMRPASRPGDGACLKAQRYTPEGPIAETLCPAEAP